MEYQKIANLLDNVSNQPSKFRTKNWVEINDESKEGMLLLVIWDLKLQFKTLMVRSSLCHYTDAHILVKVTIKISGAADDAAARRAQERNKGVIFKKCAPFTKCISKINETKIDNAQYIDIVMAIYNLIEYSDNYSKTPGSLWQYYKDEINDNLANSKSFKSKVKITRNTPAGGNTKDVKIIAPLKYLSNFWRTLEMSMINREISLFLTWSSSCAITNLQAKEDLK